MTAARTLFLTALVVVIPLRTTRADPPADAFGPAAPQAARTVFVGRGLDNDQALVFAATLAASRHPGVLLLDTPGARAANRRFLNAYQPAQVVSVGRSADADEPALVWDGGPPDALWRALLPRAERVVVCPAAPRRLLLHAAALAGAVQAPLFVLRGQPEDGQELHRRLDNWQAREVLLVGAADERALRLTDVRVHRLADEESVVAATVEAQAHRGAVDTLVVANPADAGLAELAPWIAASRRAALVLTNDRGNDVTAAVRAALAEYLLLVARPGAVGTERRDNPLPGRDETIEMEPLTPAGREPYTFATGRLFHADPGIVALMLARPRLLPPDGSPRTALVASNPGGSLPLLETCSRVSTHELQNSGYQTTALIGDLLSPGQLRRRLPECDLFLWEGHHNTLIKDWGFATWDEPLRPSLMFLQSCLALTEEKATPLLSRGALAVVGSSSRIYSATGGAFSLSYLDAVLYDRQTLGGALRQSKNFLLAYSQLKEKRLGPQAKLAGANLRSAWAFTLWGDPALRLPAPPTPADAAPAVRSRVRGDVITLTVPPSADATEGAGRYRVPFRPNARLAGLVRPGEDESRRLVPFVFAEVPLPQAPPGATPRLETKVAGSSWVFCWDARRRTGCLLALPRDGAQEMRFRVVWEPNGQPATGGGQ
jgi:hypothetical protein